LLKEGIDISFTRDVAHDREGLPSCACDIGDGFSEMGSGTAKVHDMCSLLGEEARGGATDTSSSTRYNSDAIFECIHTKDYSRRKGSGGRSLLSGRGDFVDRGWGSRYTYKK
jgi:hypothetical protein